VVDCGHGRWLSVAGGHLAVLGRNTDGWKISRGERNYPRPLTVSRLLGAGRTSGRSELRYGAVARRISPGVTPSARLIALVRCAWS